MLKPPLVANGELSRTPEAAQNPVTLLLHAVGTTACMFLCVYSMYVRWMPLAALVLAVESSFKISRQRLDRRMGRDHAQAQQHVGSFSLFSKRLLMHESKLLRLH